VRHVSWQICERVAKFVIANPDILEINIQGHADAVGTEEHNLVLSRERAESVRRLLIQYGVEQERVKAQAFGRTHLKVETLKAEQANRRVEFFVTRSRAKANVLTPPSSAQKVAPGTAPQNGGTP
jgi:outer membrane protein OmpA-like peptidoglycan-associated protein